ncbi:MAG: PAS domain S-box protein [Chloroflexi bacterium]|nr:PAS domain S-box protein [Chloroflexota bacterium]
MFAGALLLLLAAGFLATGVWAGTGVYTVLGLGTALAPFLSGVRGDQPESVGDLFALLMGVGAATTGLIMLGRPDQFSAPIYNLARPYLPWHGAAFLGGGLALAATQLRPSWPRMASQVAHLLVAGAFFVFLLALTLHLRAWTGIVYYGGFGLVLALLPWLGPRLGRVDPASLRTQLALALAAATALPLIVGATLDASQEDRVATTEALAEQRIMAAALAQDVAEYTGLYRAAVAALAAQPGLWAMPPEAQQPVLEALGAAYPNVLAFFTYDPAGNLVARSGGRPPVAAAGYPFYEDARRTNGPALDMFLLPPTGRPVFVLAAPIRGPDGRFAGLAAASLESVQVAELLVAHASVDPGGQVYLVDGEGRAIAHPEAALVASVASLSAAPPVAALLAGSGASGALSYPAPTGARLAGYARVPGLGWGVVVERPVAAVLAATRASRDLAFGMLLLIVAVAAAVGAATANWLSAPLATLAQAVDRLAAGDTTAPLPRSRISELGHLAAAFGEMRDRLAARTAERDRVEQALRESEGLKRAILASALDSIITIDHKGRILEFNPAAERTFGYTRHEVLGKPMAALIVPSPLQAAHRRAIERYLATGEGAALNRRVEVMARRADGSEVPAEVAITRIPLDGPPMFTGYVRDITERKRTEAERARLLEAVEGERAALAAVMASMSDGLAILDAGRQVRYCNARAAVLLGTGPQTLVGKSSEDAFALIRQTLADPEAGWAAWEQALARLDERPRFELELVGPPRRDILVQVFPVIDGAGTRLGTGLVLDDVTVERELVRTKDELVSVVSHELRTPLASLVGFAELLLTREYPEAQQQQFLTVMLEEGRRLAALINDFLDLQRMESGHQQLAPEPAPVRPLLERAAAAAGEDAQRPIVLQVPDGLPPVRADPDRVHQVLANLLSNARKYSPSGGEVYLSAHLANGGMEIAVRDHGLGLPPEALPHLFQKFFRVDNSDRRAIAGTGLGLAIARKIVEAHGGRIRAESAGLGQGACFSFTLPLALPGPTRGEVLVVEDDASFARLLEAELASRGLSAVLAADAETALEQVAKARPRAVLLDLLLPGLQGEAFLSRLREAGGAPVPVVVVTVKDLSQEERQALARMGTLATLRKGPGVAPAAVEAIGLALAEQEVLLEGQRA